MSEPPLCDVLAFGPHPDDVESACGGWLARLIHDGKSVGICDLTAGESGTRGTVETRAAEVEAATALLGISERSNLGMPDGALRPSIDAERAVVAEIRRCRPSLVLAPHGSDAHPDHRYAAKIIADAWFVAGLRKMHDDLGDAWRPNLLVHYLHNESVAPSFCVDISGQVDFKQELIRSYATQVDLTDTGHIHRRRDLLQRIEARDSYWGMQMGTSAAEPYWIDGPVPVHVATGLLSN